jgi:hypothetical protein
MNRIPLINGHEYGWADIAVSTAGHIVTGITGIEYNDDQEIVNVYGAGRYPVSRGKGRITCSGKITLLTSEVIALQKKAPNGRLQDIAPFPIIVSYIPDDGGEVVVDKLRNCQFKTNKRNWAEGDTSKTVDIDLIISHIEWHK